MAGANRTLPLIVVMCTGNMCRSPMAEALFRHHLQKKGLCAEVISRGLAAPVGRKPHPYAMEVALENGVPLPEDKRAAAITAPELAAATVVFVMDAGHRREVQKRFPTATGKTFLLGQWGVGEIADPINSPREAFETAWKDLDSSVQTWLEHLHAAGLIPASSGACDRNLM